MENFDLLALAFQCHIFSLRIKPEIKTVDIVRELFPNETDPDAMLDRFFELDADFGSEMVGKAKNALMDNSTLNKINDIDFSLEELFIFRVRLQNAESSIGGLTGPLEGNLNRIRVLLSASSTNEAVLWSLTDLWNVTYHYTVASQIRAWARGS